MMHYRIDLDREYGSLGFCMLAYDWQHPKPLYDQNAGTRTFLVADFRAPGPHLQVSQINPNLLRMRLTQEWPVQHG